MNRKELSKMLAEKVASAERADNPSKREVQSIAQNILANHITDIFIDCEISVSTAMDVIDQVIETITAETIINREANKKEFFC